MPLPLFLIPLAIKGAAIAAGVVGVGSAIDGAVKMSDANDKMKEAQSRQEKNEAKMKSEEKQTTQQMDLLGKKELEIMSSFKEFSDVFERIQNRPNFATYSKNGFTLPKYDGNKFEEVSVGAEAILSGLGGGGVGTLGGIAAAGAAKVVVMSIGTASTGTAISSLSGAAATNATLALLGGGTLAAGGGGMAAGTAALGAATLGVGLLVGGVIFSLSGSKISGQADEAWNTMLDNEKKISKICQYLTDLRGTADTYYKAIQQAESSYREHLRQMKSIVYGCGKTNWNYYTAGERLLVENTVLLVQLLYDMCKVELVLKSSDKNGINTVNHQAVTNTVNKARTVLGSI